MVDISRADREKLDALALRVGRGFDVLFEREQADRRDASYEQWLGVWVKLLVEYETEMDRLGVTK